MVGMTVIFSQSPLCCWCWTFFPFRPITHLVVPPPGSIPVSSDPYNSSSGILLVVLVWINMLYQAVLVFSLTARPLAVSRGQDQYVLSLFECFSTNLQDHFFPIPHSGNAAPKWAEHIPLTCSQSRRWLGGKPWSDATIAYLMTCSTSEGSNQPFSVFVSAFDLPPLAHRESVDSLSWISLPVSTKKLSEVCLQAAFALSGFVPSAFFFSSENSLTAQCMRESCSSRACCVFSVSDRGLPGIFESDSGETDNWMHSHTEIDLRL